MHESSAASMEAPTEGLEWEGLEDLTRLGDWDNALADFEPTALNQGTEGAERADDVPRIGGHMPSVMMLLKSEECVIGNRLCVFTVEWLILAD